MEAQVARDIDRAEVDLAIAAPELAVVDLPWRVVHMRQYFDGQLGRQTLLRVVVEETPQERVVEDAEQVQFATTG